MPQILEFSQMMSGVAAGSEEAVWQLAETYTPYIIRAVRASLSRSVRLRLDSQDFAQVLWASLLLGDADLTRLKTPEQLIAFLARAAQNKVIDATRRHLNTQRQDMHREVRLEDIQVKSTDDCSSTSSRSMPPSREPSPSEFAYMRERWRLILSEATDRDRQILQLRLERHTFDAISKHLQIDKRTARRAMHRLIKKLSK
jgi:RNA polymerase sigma factor (sigma-70 family)